MEEKEIVFLDTETTGLYNADAIEISIVSLNGHGEESYLFNSKIKTKKTIEIEAFNIHKISKKDLKNAPTFRSIYGKLNEILKNKIVVIYNRDFDLNVINNMCNEIKKENLLEGENTFCLMNEYAYYFNDYHNYFESYTWQKLTKAYNKEIKKENVSILDIENIKPHTALGDCIMSKYVFIYLYGNKINKKTSFKNEDFSNIFFSLEQRKKYVY